MPDTQYHFDELFVEYVQSFFFKHPGQNFSVDDLVRSLPPFYRDSATITAAIHILLLRDSIIPVPLKQDPDGENRDKWTASIARMGAIAEEKRIKNETAEVDLALKKIAKRNYWAPLILSALSLIISAAVAVFTFIRLFG